MRLGLDLLVAFELELPAALDLELGPGLQTASVWDLPPVEIEPEMELHLRVEIELELEREVLNLLIALASAQRF
jgi:hypothetical protein